MSGAASGAPPPTPPPPLFDKAAFTRTLPLVALCVPTGGTDAAVRALRSPGGAGGESGLLALPRVRAVAARAGEPAHRFLLLRAGAAAEPRLDAVADPALRAAIAAVAARFPHSPACCGAGAGGAGGAGASTASAGAGAPSADGGAGAGADASADASAGAIASAGAGRSAAPPAGDPAGAGAGASATDAPVGASVGASAGASVGASAGAPASASAEPAPASAPASAPAPAPTEPAPAPAPPGGAALLAQSPPLAAPRAAAPLLVPWPLTVGYEQMTADAVLRALLPAGVGDVVSSFETAGHVAHVNLRDELLPFKHVIGAVLLDKNAGALRAVYNKTAAIATRFRTFPMELLAGVDDTLVELRHCGATFRFDFRAVYWNSRLQKEHEHVVERVVPAGARVADAFAGVGPFAVPLGARGCRVLANDLNPASHAALVDAIRRNRVGAAVTPSCEDARAFLRRVLGAREPLDAVLMNLPADALAFLDVFVGAWAHPPPAGAAAGGGGGGEGGGGGGGGGGVGGGGGGGDARPPGALPVIHVYCFSRAATEADAADDAVARALEALRLPPLAPLPPRAAGGGGGGGGGAVADADDAVAAADDDDDDPTAGGAGGAGGIDAPLVRAARARGGPLPGLTVRTVRDVAPRKLMLCVSFRLPRAVAEARPVVTDETLARAAERDAAGAAGAEDAADGARRGEGAGDDDDDPRPAKRSRQ